MPLRSSLLPFLLVVGLISSSTAATVAAEPSLDAVQKDGIAFLKATQRPDGSWTAPQALGITALCTNALLRSGVPADDPVIEKSIAFLKSHVRDDGGIYVEGSTHRNYETVLSVLVFKKIDDGKPFAEILKGADKFLRELQWDEGEGLESSDTEYGGAGYGGKSRPDLSNTQFLLEALKELGAEEDDPAIQKALVFVSRTQNLEGEYNTTEFAARVNDGGFYYTPAAGGTSQAGTTESGGLRSYGSMTYAGLKSLIYAGLTDDDPRIKAANEWIKKHYTLKENPGLGGQGLYYYFHTFAKTMATVGKPTITDAEGVEHNWRTDLLSRLAELQRDNGSWVNKAERWYEGDPNLSTAYALMALSYCETK